MRKRWCKSSPGLNCSAGLFVRLRHIWSANSVYGVWSGNMWAGLCSKPVSLQPPPVTRAPSCHPPLSSLVLQVAGMGRESSDSGHICISAAMDKIAGSHVFIWEQRQVQNPSPLLRIDPECAGRKSRHCRIWCFLFRSPNLTSYFILQIGELCTWLVSLDNLFTKHFWLLRYWAVLCIQSCYETVLAVSRSLRYNKQDE